MSAHLLDIRGVGFAVKGTSLIADVDLHVNRGDWLSIIGPNGAGKSTLPVSYTHLTLPTKA